jgi:hypothetical protein
MSTELQAAAGGRAGADVKIAVRNSLVIDFLVKRCKQCGKEIFDSSTKPRKFCDNNNRCCMAYSRSVHDRDRSIGFDGRYSGPLSGIRMRRATGPDRGFHPIILPKDADVHVKPIEPKFNQVTPEDVDWAERQKSVDRRYEPRKVRASFRGSVGHGNYQPLVGPRLKDGAFWLRK